MPKSSTARPTPSVLSRASSTRACSCWANIWLSVNSICSRPGSMPVACSVARVSCGSRSTSSLARDTLTETGTTTRP